MTKTYTRPDPVKIAQTIRRDKRAADRAVTIERKSRRKFIASNGGR